MLIVFSEARRKQAQNEWVFGAGGWNIFHHIGVAKAARELGVGVDTALGASAGALFAAFLTNGYEPDELVPIFLAMRKLRLNPHYLLQGMRIADPLSLMIGGGFSLRPYMEELVERYNLKPNDKLRILACNFFDHEPVIFEGTDYDLAKALAASGAVPGLFQPVWHFAKGRNMLLVDGAIYHYNPTEFSSGLTIVSKFRPASELPTEWELPSDLYFHLREMYFPVAGNNRDVDTSKHVVIESGIPYVAGLNFGLSENTCRKMVENGYNTAMSVLRKEISSGRVIVNVPAR